MPITEIMEVCISLWYDACQNCLQDTLVEAIDDFPYIWQKQEKGHEEGQTMSILQALCDLDLPEYEQQCQEG